MIRSTAISLLVAGLAALGVASAPAAAAGIVSLTVSTSEDVADGGLVFPVGTTELYAIFEYEEMSNQSISIEIDGPGLPGLYESDSQRYSGDGTDYIKVTGAELYSALVSDLLQVSLSAQSNIGLVQSQSVVHTYLTLAQENVRHINQVLGLLMSLDDQEALGAAQVQQLLAIADGSSEIDSLLDEALDTSVDLAGKQALAGKMADFAEGMVENSRSLSDHAQGVDTIPLPETGPEVARSGFTVQVMINDYLAEMVEIGISGAAAAEDENPPPSASATPSTSGAIRVTATRPARPGSSRPTSASGSGSSGGTSSGSTGDDEESETTRELATAPTGGQDLGTEPAFDIRSVTGTPLPESDSTPEGSGLAAEGRAPDLSRPQREQAGGSEEEGAPIMGAPAGEPTWTPRSLPGSSGEADGSEIGREPDLGADPGTSGAGPNLAIVALGAIVLAGLAFWFRRSA